MSPETLPGELLDRVQALTEQLDELRDAHARELAQELVGAVIAMYGDGLRRIIEAVQASREAGATILDELAQDGAVASLLLIHDLYPVGLEERVTEALDTVRPYMESHGGNVVLLGIEDGVARLEMQGSCNGCAASRATLELAIKQALDEHAPDLVGLEVRGVVEPAGNGGGLPMAGAAAQPGQDMPGPLGSFELPVVHAGMPSLPMLDDRPPRWVPLEPESGLEPGGLRALDADGVALLLANVEGSLLAYRDTCAACGDPLHDGELHGHMLRCPSCAVEFDLPRAGRAAGGEPLQLTPVPLLASGGIRVAV
jgi:Fe-S cluster biogenesis protein NfuA/nitrite reductase/ring-hydroxylating ferredoxin subunit